MREILEKYLEKKPFFLKTKDVEEITNMSHNAVNKLIKSGKLVAYKTGSKNFRIPKNSLIDYIVDSKIEIKNT